MRLYRAVSATELADIKAHEGVFRDSRNNSLKGFFFDASEAEKLGKRFAEIDGEEYVVVETEASETVVKRGIPHRAAQEGDGVYLRTEDLYLLTPATEVKP